MLKTISSMVPPLSFSVWKNSMRSMKPPTKPSRISSDSLNLKILRIKLLLSSISVRPSTLWTLLRNGSTKEPSLSRHALKAFTGTSSRKSTLWRSKDTNYWKTFCTPKKVTSGHTRTTERSNLFIKIPIKSHSSVLSSSRKLRSLLWLFLLWWPILWCTDTM